VSYRQPIPLFSSGGYRRFTSFWWGEKLHWTLGLRLRPFRWRTPGWIRDLYEFWHRGRYGWAPSDTWGLDRYLNGVLAGSLEHLAQHLSGVPAGFLMTNADDTMETNADVDARAKAWEELLLRWAKAFSEDPEDVDIFDTADGYKAHHAEEERRRAAIHQALKEMEPWWEALWD
jgi:hypothetical protein